MSTSSEVVVVNPLDSVQDELHTHDADATALVVMANEYQCTDVHEYETGVDAVQRMRAQFASVMAFFKPMADDTNRAHKTVTSRRSEITKPIEDAIMIVERKVGLYRIQQKRIADQQAAAERRRLEAVEKERREAEALAAADANDELGFHRAARMEGAPVPLPVEVTAPEILKHTAPKSKGMREAVRWESGYGWTDPDGNQRAAVNDQDSLRELCRAVADGKTSIAFIAPVWDALDAYAKATAGTMPVPGILFQEVVKTTIPKLRGS